MNSQNKTKNITISVEQFVNLVGVLFEPNFNSDLEKFWEDLLAMCAKKLISIEHVQNWSFVKEFNSKYWKFIFGGNRNISATEVPSYNPRTRTITCSVTCEVDSPLDFFLKGEISREDLRAKFYRLDVSKCYLVTTSIISATNN